MKTQKNLLIISGDSEFLESCKEEVLPEFKVITASDGVEGTMKFNNQHFDIVLADHELQKKTGLELYKEILKKESNRKTPLPYILIIPKDVEFNKEETESEYLFFLKKPVTVSGLNEFLRNILVLTELDLNKVVQLNLPPGRAVFEDGDIGSDFYYVLSGELTANKISEDGDDVEVGTIGGGEFLGEMSLITGEKRSASIITSTECRVVRVPSAKFREVFASTPMWYQLLIKTLANRIANLSKTAAEDTQIRNLNDFDL